MSYIYLYDVMFMVLVGAQIFGLILLANENTNRYIETIEKELLCQK
ncbi:MAG: hypothetical protein ACTSQG_06340 [Promethearchaeota archaeon]